MSNTISPNMNLVIPGVGTEPGPTYATDINSSLTLIDQHTHTAGSGVLITPAAISINSALTFASNFATNVAGMTFATQSSTPANKTIYNNANDLYFVDGLGNNIRLTQSGAVAGTSGSISNLVAPASANYSVVGATFVWQSNVNIAANMDFGSAILRNITPNSTFGLTLSPPSALGNDYTITLPTLPGSNLPLSINSSGTMSAATITGAQISTSAGIVGTQLSASANILGSQLSASAGIVGGQIASATITNSNLVNNTINLSKISTGSINQGVYTPIVTNPTGCSIVSVPGFQYILVGNIVNVSGSLTIGSTTPGNNISFNMSLPVVANNFTGVYQAGGTTFTTTSFSTGGVTAQVSSTTIYVAGPILNASGNESITMSFTYGIQ